MSDRNNMTKKHFIAIAFAVKELDIDTDSKRKVAEAMANFCQTQNSGFSRERFLAACLDGLIQARHDTKARAFTANDVR